MTVVYGSFGYYCQENSVKKKDLSKILNYVKEQPWQKKEEKYFVRD